jgi:hypothetical protein
MATPARIGDVYDTKQAKLIPLPRRPHELHPSLAEKEAGMAEMSAKFRALGGEVYVEET